MPNNKTPEEYQAELMRLYQIARAQSQSAPTSQSAPASQPQPNSVPEPQTVPTPQPSPIPEPQPTPMPQPQPAPIPEPQPAPIPQPTPMSESEPAPTPESQKTPPVKTIPVPLPKPPMIPPQASPEQTEIGWIQVITRSAGNAQALPGVSVMITNGSGSDMHLEQAAITNESGETEKIALPALAASLSLNSEETRQPFVTYDVSVYADGYYRQISKSVPVFAGITSRQIFSMIPLPIYPQEPPETIVFQNTEPNL